MPASLPPLNVSPPSLGLPQLEGNAPKKSAPSPTPPHQRIPSGIPTATLRNLRTQKSTSFDHSRQSSDSQGRKRSGSSARPIITISPPHGVAEGTAAFHAPRSAPRPPGQLSSRRTSQSDRPGPDSPASDASSATSIQSSMQFPIPPADGPMAASSYKEESLLRKDHFEIGIPEAQASQRRGTVSGSNQSAPGSVGRSFMSDRQQRRHVSVLHLNRLKQEVVATTSAQPTTRVRRSGAHSDSPSTSGQSGNESTASSQGTVSPISRSKSASSPGAKKIPPPLMRTWHTPPTTGPPTEPLPSPPASATLQPLILSSAARSGAAPAPSPPVSPQKTLPPLPPKDPPARAQGAKSPDSLVSEAPPSPARSEPETPPVRTPVREDAVKKVLADENATAEELREALKTQSAKYARLMSYLLTLTERHGMEKHEFLRRIEVLEQDARRRERELKGLRWLVANSSQSGMQAMKLAAAPARADSSTLSEKEPRSRERSCSESVASASPNLGMGISTGARPGTCETVGRRSIESPAGSTEEGLFELQTTISEFIAPLVSPPLSDEEPHAPVAPSNGLPPTARLKRSNTLPDALSPLPVATSKQARRTSSPVLPVTTPASSPEKKASQATMAR
ncbi:hypothetical protein OH77DRAFT_177870 [Trametes cingulata]|nr:hypothetical protein OH77DRAFT_177870 [Trametes cingulata]